MNEPTPRSNASTPPAASGSRLHGFGLFWLILVASWIAIVIVGSALSALGIDGYGWLAVLGLLPWGAEIGAIIWFANHGSTQTAQGIAFGFLSLIGVALLLVAACFGFFIFSGANFH